MITIPPTYSYEATSYFVADRQDTQWSSSKMPDSKSTLIPKSEESLIGGSENLGEKTSVAPENKDSNSSLKSEESGNYAAIEPVVEKTEYSSTYIEHNVNLLISSLKSDFFSWSEKGTEDSYSEISRIKNTLEEYAPYLERREDTNILLGTLELLFQNNNWEKLNNKKLNLVVTELDRFRSGSVDWNSLEKFSKQLWSADIIS